MQSQHTLIGNELFVWFDGKEFEEAAQTQTLPPEPPPPPRDAFSVPPAGGHALTHTHMMVMMVNIMNWIDLQPVFPPH